MTQNIISIGQAAALIQAMPDRIRAAAVELNIEPAMRINGIAHFAETDLERIAAHLRQQKISGACTLQARAHGIS